MRNMESPHFSMSWDSFIKCILEMKALSDELHDEWTFHGEIRHEHCAYLSKKSYKNYDEIAPSAELGNFEEAGINDDDENGSWTENTLTYEYHVVFSTSYSCPVLCFNAWKTNGTLLALEECWQMLGCADYDYKYNMLTQMEHPVLMRPFLTLHPCKTAELIGTSFEKSKNPLVSWLSTVGPVVGLIISSEYAKLTF